mmetsp:Transcript_52102/g.63811  ORF Transcript_52102/g.63811 Transcript_52102/m.63811 type:complete len:208 (+) Transcript_52102:1-624(+)
MNFIYTKLLSNKFNNIKDHRICGPIKAVEYLAHLSKKNHNFLTKFIHQNVYKLRNINSYLNWCNHKMVGTLINCDINNNHHKIIATEWYTLFCKEVNVDYNPNRIINLMTEKNLYFLTINTRIVSMAAFAGLTDKIVRIGYVYTPINERRKGYATHLTGQICIMLEKQENKECWLFADKSVKASNKTYINVGFILNDQYSMLTLQTS